MLQRTSVHKGMGGPSGTQEQSEDNVENKNEATGRQRN